MTTPTHNVSATRPAPARWRIALADDHAIVRVGYRRLLELEPDLQVVAEYASADAAAHDLPTHQGANRIDLLILDLSMPGRSGLELLKQLGDDLPDLHVLVVSMHDSPAMQSQCLRAGAAGFVSKAGEPEAVVRAVRAVQSGLRTLHPQTSSSSRPAPHEQLTVRELEVLQHLISGASVDAIAQRMGVSEKTVSNYQTLVRQKLDVTNSVELLHYAQKHGLTA
ncbi:MAG: response regulator transcription factor [Burkholderiales bacterium]|nr:response regulator transcription factor [Burkholderiales bacterium]